MRHRERDREQFYYAHIYIRGGKKTVKWNKVFVIGWWFSSFLLLPVLCVCIQCVFANQCITPFISVWDVAFVVGFYFFFWFNSLKPNTKCKCNKIYSILNWNYTQIYSFQSYKWKMEEFNVMTINLLLNGFCTLELTLLVKK